MGRNEYRWLGIAFTAASVSLIFQQAIHPATVSASPQWYTGHTLGYLGLSLGVLGLIGVYAIQRPAAGRIGLAGFTLATLGNVLTAGAAYLDAFVDPVLASKAPDLVGFPPKDPALFAGPGGAVIFLAAAMVTAGFVLLGVATVRAGTLNRWAAIAVIAFSWFGFAAAFSPIVFTIAAIGFSIGTGWLGIDLVRKAGART